MFRGLHFQKPPYEQAKLVRVLKGSVVDFAIDIRKDSPTFGKGGMAWLTEENKCQFFIPRGFAHGFFVLSDEAVFEYKCDNFYNKESEGGIKWDDENINIADDGCSQKTDLPSFISTIYHGDIILSEKDKNSTTTLQDL